MNKKYLKALGTAAVCALAPAVISSGATFAAENNNNIYLYDSSESTPINCDFYRASSAPSPCSAEYGSYDEATQTLTLGSKINELDNPSVNIYMTGVTTTIKANADVATKISIHSGAAETIFDLGQYTLNLGSSSTDNNDGTFTFKSGKYIFPDEYSGFSAKNITVDGGSFEVKGSKVGSLFDANENLVINDGEINFEGLHMFKSANLEINGGKIVGNMLASNGTLIGEHNTKNPLLATINGGDIELNCKEKIICSQIYASSENSELVINDGVLTLNNGDKSIQLNNGGKIRFNGGTTTINNAIKYSMIIYEAKDPENDIVFGEGMGIKENIPVYWSLNEDGYTQSTGIVGGVGTVTIANGYTYTKHHGWDIGHNDKEPDDNNQHGENSNIPTVPDTGIFGMDGKTATIVGAIAALPVLATLAYGIKFIIKRNKQRVRF